MWSNLLFSGIVLHNIQLYWTSSRTIAANKADAGTAIVRGLFIQIIHANCDDNISYFMLCSIFYVMLHILCYAPYPPKRPNILSPPPSLPHQSWTYTPKILIHSHSALQNLYTQKNYTLAKNTRYSSLMNLYAQKTYTLEQSTKYSSLLHLYTQRTYTLHKVRDTHQNLYTRK